MNDDSLSPQLTGLAASLANLTPAGASVNRDTLMYRAGWAAAEAEFAESPASRAEIVPNPAERPSDEYPRWIWPSVAGLLAVVCIVLGLTHWGIRHTVIGGGNLPPVVVPVPAEPKPQLETPAAAKPADVNTYLQLRRDITAGAGELPFKLPTPSGSASEGESKSYPQQLRKLLGG